MAERYSYRRDDPIYFGVVDVQLEGLKKTRKRNKGASLLAETHHCLRFSHHGSTKGDLPASLVCGLSRGWDASWRCSLRNWSFVLWRRVSVSCWSLVSSEDCRRSGLHASLSWRRGHKPRQRCYTIYTVLSWERWVRVLLCLLELICTTGTCTAQLARQNRRAATYEEKYALFIRIVIFYCLEMITLNLLSTGLKRRVRGGTFGSSVRSVGTITANSSALPYGRQSWAGFTLSFRALPASALPSEMYISPYDRWLTMIWADSYRTCVRPG